MSDLQTSPAHTAESEPKYDRLKHADIGTILRLHDEGLAQALIAQHVGCHQTSVGRVLRDLADDTSDLAVRRFKATALRAADRVITIAEKSEDEGEALKASKVILAASGVTERVSGVNVGVQVVIGQPGAPAGSDPFQGQTVTVNASNGESR